MSLCMRRHLLVYIQWASVCLVEFWMAAERWKNCWCRWEQHLSKHCKSSTSIECVVTCCIARADIAPSCGIYVNWVICTMLPFQTVWNRAHRSHGKLLERPKMAEHDRYLFRPDDLLWQTGVGKPRLIGWFAFDPIKIMNFTVKFYQTSKSIAN